MSEADAVSIFKFDTEAGDITFLCNFDVQIKYYRVFCPGGNYPNKLCQA
jgi:hypothetical protein